MKGLVRCKMLNYIEFLGIPTTAAIVIVAAFLCIQIIGEVLEFKGKVVPEFVKIRKYFRRKKEERKQKFDEESKKLNELSNEYRKQLPLEIEQFEDMLNMKFKEVIFDSEICDWSMTTSTFDKRLIGKDKLLLD